jgi:hypothetical protein
MRRAAGIPKTETDTWSKLIIFVSVNRSKRTRDLDLDLPLEIADFSGRPVAAKRQRTGPRTTSTYVHAYDRHMHARTHGACLISSSFLRTNQTCVFSPELYMDNEAKYNISREVQLGSLLACESILVLLLHTAANKQVNFDLNEVVLMLGHQVTGYTLTRPLTCICLLVARYGQSATITLLYIF